MVLTVIEESLVLAAYYRGGSHDDQVWTSNTDQILTLSLYFTGDISDTDCVERFSIYSDIVLAVPRHEPAEPQEAIKPLRRQ